MQAVENIVNNPKLIIHLTEEMFVEFCSNGSNVNCSIPFDSLFDHTFEPLCILDNKGEVIKINEAFSKLSGWNEEELTGTRLPLFDHFDLENPNHSAFIEIEGKSIKRKDGTMIQVLTRVLPLQGEGTFIVLFIETAPADVDEIFNLIDQEHKETVQREALYRSLVEDALVGVYLYQEGKIIYANPIFAKIFGYTREELISVDFIELVVDEEREYMINKFTFDEERTGSDSMNHDYQVRGIRKNGYIIDLEGHIAITHFQEKPALIGTIHEITERIETDRRYQRLLKLSPEPIMLHRDDEIIYVNDAGLQLFGIQDQMELIGHSFVGLIHPHDQENILNILDTVVKTDQKSEYHELKLIRLDGNIVEVESSAIHIYKYMGGSVIQSVFRDITERKQTEELIRRSEKLSLVGQMAAGVAHEIRNPLTAIKGFSQLLKEKNNEFKDFYEIMISELDRINDIVNEFMFLAKPNPIQFKKVALRSILDNVISLMNTQAIMNNVSIQVLYDNDQVCIKCDENQIKQVFINILKNAVDAMPNGGDIIITCSKPQDQDEVLIMFIDQGIGIPKDRLRKIGEPFYTTKEQGTGLGLMLSYKIIESHKGKINIHSEINKGTTIEIVLPNC